MESVENLKSKALNYWPASIAEKEKSSSIIPKLIETQDKFISLLNIANSSPESWTQVLKNTSGLTPNLFLKHLLVLSDIGGERLKRFNSDINELFPDSKFQFTWNDNIHEYEFKSIKNGKVWSNGNLNVDGDSLLKGSELNDEMTDVAMLILYGGLSLSDNLPQEIEDKCIIGSLLGDKVNLDTFVRQRYIWVSRITGGATSNAMGYLAEDFVKEHLKNNLNDWDFSQKSIPGISQNDGRTNMSFDIVATSPSGVYCAIELSFQVTTNSVIERKAGQARARLSQLNKNNHYIAYVIDGAGNFERRSALNTIIKFSDVCVTFSEDELDRLVNFLKEIEK